MAFWLVDAIESVERAEAALGGEALAKARGLIRELDTMSAVHAHVGILAVHDRCLEEEGELPHNLNVAERKVRNVVVSFIVSRLGAWGLGEKVYAPQESVAL